MPQLPVTITARPTVTVDARAGRVVDPTRPDPTYPGQPGPYGPFEVFGRQRVVTALPTNNDGPVLIDLPLVIGGAGGYVVDPDGNFVGVAGALYIHRLVSAHWVEDTRRLGG